MSSATMHQVYTAPCKCGEHRGAKLPKDCPTCGAPLRARPAGKTLRPMEYIGPKGETDKRRMGMNTDPAHKTPPTQPDRRRARPTIASMADRIVALLVAALPKEHHAAAESAVREVLRKQAGPSRTHCANGHALTPENTRIGKGNRRDCVTCMTERRKQMQQLWALARKAKGAK